MKYVIIAFLLLFLSIVLGIWVAQDSGYVLLTYGHWSIETSVLVALCCLILLFLVLYILLRSIARLWHIPRAVRRYRTLRAYQKYSVLTTAGYCALIEGNGALAESLFLKASPLLKQSLLCDLLAAEAAQLQDAPDRRDRYLQQAQRSAQKCATAIAVRQGVLQLEAGQPEQARITLAPVYQKDPRNNYLLTLLKKIALQSKDESLLYQLLPALRRYGRSTPEELDRLEIDIYRHRLQEAGAQNKTALLTVWQSVARHCREENELLNLFVAYLIKYEEENQAMALIEEKLKKQWDAPLAVMYTFTAGPNPERQLSMAESWVQKYEKEPEALLCAGYFNLKQGFLQKAEDYLKDSVRIKPSARAYEALGCVYEQRNDIKNAITYFRKGLQYARDVQGSS